VDSLSILDGRHLVSLAHDNWNSAGDVMEELLVDPEHLLVKRWANMHQIGARKGRCAAQKTAFCSRALSSC